MGKARPPAESVDVEKWQAGYPWIHGWPGSTVGPKQGLQAGLDILADFFPGLTCRISYGAVRHHCLVVGLFLNRPTCPPEVFDDAVEVPVHLESQHDPVEAQVWACSKHYGLKDW